MKHSTFLRPAPLALSALLCCANAHAQMPTAPATTNAPTAQKPTAPATADAPQLQTAVIPVKNMPVGLMAWWLDPAHQSVPLMIQLSAQFRGGFSSATNPLASSTDMSYLGSFFLPADQTANAPEGSGLAHQPGSIYRPAGLKLPDGIVSLFSVDPQNALLAKGTAAALRELETLVTQNDIALNQVEIEAHFCEVSSSDLGALGLPLDSITDNSLPAALLAPTDTSRRINGLVATNKLTVITAPRVTSVNGLTTELHSTITVPYMSPTIFTPTEEALAKQDKNWRPGLTSILVEDGIVCTPIVRGDWVTLSMKATLQGRILQFVTTMKDGQTLAILAAPNQTDKRLVVFVTSRIVRRAGDTVAAQ